MPLRRADAIVLRSHRVGEADKLVVFFSREYGKLTGRARAARRPKSRFGGALEIGTEVELTFFEKESRELVSVDRCDILRSRFLQLGDPILASTLGYATDLVDRFSLEREPNPRLYRLLRAMVDAIAGGASPEACARYFEAWLLRLVGFYPRRRTCPKCGRPLADSGARYLASEQRIECRSCLGSGVFLSPQALGYLDQIWTQPPGEIPAPESARVLRELSAFHNRLIQEQLDKDLRSRQVLEDLLHEDGIR